jgi:hypothetical protein
MGQRVDARDVLDPNGRTRRQFRARVLGHFRPTGANSWDDYEYVSGDEGELDVLPDLPVQVEPTGAQLRLRGKGGRVVRLVFVPGERDRARLGEDAPPSAVRRYLLSEYIASFAEDAGVGAAAVIARKLDE